MGGSTRRPTLRSSLHCMSCVADSVQRRGLPHCFGAVAVRPRLSEFMRAQHGVCRIQSTLRTPWSNCYRTATALELIWLRRNVTGGRFSNLYQRAYFACTNLANHRRCTKLLAHWQWRGRSRCGLGLLQNTQSFWSQSAHTAAYRVCWAIQI